MPKPNKPNLQNNSLKKAEYMCKYRENAKNLSREQELARYRYA